MPGHSSAFSPSPLFSQVRRVIDIGKQRALEPSDLPPLPEAIDPRIDAQTVESLSLASPWSFIRSVVWAVRIPTLKMSAFLGLCGLLSLASPQIIHALMEVSKLVSVDSEALMHGVLLALLLCFLNVSEALVYQQYVYRALTTHQTIVNILNNRIYSHSLSLTRFARLKTPTGEVVNLMGTDTDTVAESIWIWVELAYSLFMLVFGTVSLFRYLGVASFCAILVILLMLPLTRAMGKRLTHLDDEVMDLRDQRVSQMTQVLTGIRIVKYFGWESRIRDDILHMRSQEIERRLRLAKTRAVSVLLYVTASVVVSVATFATYVALGHTLDPSTVFASLALFSLLEGPLGNIGGFIAELAAARVSSERIRLFLREPVRGNEARDLSPPSQAFGCRFENVTLQYGDAQTPVITGANFQIRSGTSTAIVGPFGAGKTSLLLAILGEAPVTLGQISMLGLDGHLAPRWAYVPQDGFTLNGSLRENMTFGASSSEEELQEALRVCALGPDVALLPRGIDTEIGEHGVNLSGGQKQRLALARAVLSRPGLVLLDDPFAAVDEETEDILIRDLLKGVWQNVSRVVVTHRLKHLAAFDQVVFVEGGQIVASGPYRELLEKEQRFATFVAASDHFADQETKSHSDSSSVAQENRDHSADGRITEDEDRERGSVSAQLYLEYLRAMAGNTAKEKRFTYATLILSAAAASFLPIAQSSWLAMWTSRLAHERGSPLFGIMIFGGIGLAVIFAAFSQNLWWALRAIKAGSVLHDQALSAILRAKVRFFDATPIGRILNRFSRDLDSIEKSLPNALEGTVRSVLNLLGAMGLLFALVPHVVFVAIPSFWWFLKIQALYRASAREAQRMSSVARSPRFAHFKETLSGLTVIRAYHREQHFFTIHQEKLAHYQQVFHGMVAINRWFSTRVPLASAVVSLAATCGMMVSARFGVVTIGSVGLALTYATRFWGNLNWAVRCFSDVESRMTAVERLRSFAVTPPEQEVSSGKALDPQESWPSLGEVRFESVTVRYASHLPDVLRDVHMQICGGSRVGLIGRTGSGKSTILQTLFRFVEPRLGRITIDGVDIGSVPLRRLRRTLAIIPQDPTLFRGTIRDNLDRFGECSDQSIWNALERVYLLGFVKTLPGGLDYPVAENGHNFSQGQRQLFCLARALLVNARIIVMDEATASVDVETDALIQKAIHEAFAGRTMIIIAHRLGTIADCDQIIALDKGRARIVRARERDRLDPSYMDPHPVEFKSYPMVDV